MLVNNIDVTTFGVLSVDRDIQLSEVTTYEDWLRKGLSPVINYQKEYFKKIKCKFFFRAKSHEEVLSNISNFTSELKTCTLKFDDLDFYYDCTLENSNIIHHNILEKTLEIEFKCAYSYKAVITENIDNQNTKVINSQGNLPAPAIVTIVLPIDIISYKIDGFEDSIIVNNIHANIPIIIDGEKCIVTENGQNKFSDVDMWSFPTIKPGENTISVDNSKGSLTIKYKPKWL